MSRFPRLRNLLSAIVIASLPAAAAGCCGPAPTQERVETIDPQNPVYKPLVTACVADDLTCADLCEEILRQRGVADADTASFSECRIIDPALTQVRMTYSFPYDCVGGRRPEGLAGRLADADASPAARWLAQMAHLEAAAVYAFANTAIQLARLGAPRQLVARAVAAADEEVVHTMIMTRLARQRGLEPPPVEMTEPAPMSLYELALDNAVEGCVRETYGALIATYQAHTAADADVRAALARISVDETGHAELSAAIDAWAMPHLDADQRARIAVAHRAAVAEVLAAANRAVEPELAAAVGLPSPATASRMARALLG